RRGRSDLWRGRAPRFEGFGAGGGIRRRETGREVGSNRWVVLLSTIIARAAKIASIPLLALILLSTAPDSLGAPEGPMPSNCDYQLGQCFQYGLASPHFVVFYNTTGELAVSSDWAGN